MAFSTINKSSLYQNTVLYTGNASTNAITGVGFQPDLVWGKDRGGDRHFWADSVRGKNGTGYSLLACNNTEADTSNYPPDGVTAIGADGFTLGANTSNDNGGWSNEINQSSGTYASWNWKAGTTTGIAGSPTITPTSYSFNQTSGFSMIEYVGNGTSGATIPHGLGVKPAMIIVKGVTYAEEWEIYHQSLGATETIKLNGNGAATSSTNRWNDTEPTTSLFSVGDADATNKDTYTYIAYCFAELSGYSKFSSYVGNGNADGAFVYTGFKPSFIVTKRVTGTENWMMFDNKRLGYNVDNNYLFPNLTNAEVATEQIDILSNGFKMRTTNDAINNSGGECIYMAFGQPIISNSGICATAR